MPRYRHRARGGDGRLSSQHHPSDIFAGVGIDHDEIHLPFSPSAQFVETMIVEIPIDDEASQQVVRAMKVNPDRLCRPIGLHPAPRTPGA